MTTGGFPDGASSDHDGRPTKRPRQAKEDDDGIRPYTIPMSAPAGVPFETDPAGEGSAKKARKRPLSCGECRRLKLKCDRVFPCQSCCKRGCAEICPEGALTGGKGSRFILANTEQLHEKIKSMSERIRQLEEAVSALQSQLSADEHPLLRQELLLIKKSPELFGVEQQTASSATTSDNLRRDDGHTRAGSSSSSREGDDYAGQQVHLIIPEELASLSRTFPSPWSISFELNPDMRQRIRDMLPPRQEAQYLCEQARNNAFWQFNPDPSETFIPNLIHSVYTTPLQGLLPHRLGLLLMILAIGSMVDSNQAPSRHQAERYHHLARAALSEVPMMDDTSFDAVHALFFMEWYLLMFSDHKKAAEYAWGIMGLTTKLAHTIGLHRDGVRSKVIPEELDKRRTLFWDLANIDTRLALMLRRPPSINIHHVDAKQPTCSSDGNVVGAGSCQYHEWQHLFLQQCMMPVLESIVSPQPLSYFEVLGLDAKIRDFSIPTTLQMVDHGGAITPYPLVMQQAMTAGSREIALLQLHRSYFTMALADPQVFDVKHKYMPSVLAAYSSSRKLIWIVRNLYRLQRDLSTRFVSFWSNCFSAAVALCFLVTRAPSFPLARIILEEMDKVVSLFSEVREQCPTVARMLPSLDLLTCKARSTYTHWCNGTRDEFGDMEEICVIARRAGILVSPSAAHAAIDGPEDSFKFAHSYLLRCLEKVTAEPSFSEPPMNHNGSHGSCSNPQISMSFGVSGERESLRMGEPGPSTNGETPMSGPPSPSRHLLRRSGNFGADIQDCSWMSWF